MNNICEREFNMHHQKGGEACVWWWWGVGWREEHKSINSLMSQQSGINQLHVEQFLPLRWGSVLWAQTIAPHTRLHSHMQTSMCTRTQNGNKYTQVFLHKYAQCVCRNGYILYCAQARKHSIGMTKLEAWWREEGGFADEDDDDLNWIQTALCSLV